jgi:hypothetical protein
MSGLGRENKAFKIARIVATLCMQYWPLALLGAAIALVPLLAFALNSTISGLPFLVLLALGVFPALIFIVAAASGGAVYDILNQLPKNEYGMCSGSRNMQPDEAGVLPLTDWLHEYFQRLANLPLDRPVTFGDLWGTTNKNPFDEREIELVLMTTNVTRGVSHRFPFLEGSWGQLFFKKDEFDKLFPEAVVKCLTDHPAEIRQADDIEVEGFHSLPDPANLPILLGARMSLSFPFLLSAVPLYAANFEGKKQKGKFPLERCWFSDGGLTSNFPIHFFDAPIPLRPTFGINLIPDTVDLSETAEIDGRLKRVGGVKAGKATNEAAQPGWDKIWMPSKNAMGIGSAARFNNFSTISGFFTALFDTARNWSDTELTAMAGYRDRIVHVKLAENEGGLNLNMPPEIIQALGDRGERAGMLLAARFAPTPTGGDRLTDPQTGEYVELTWDNHRWIRYRTVLAAFENLARRLRATWQVAEKQKPWRSYGDLLCRTVNDEPTCYLLKRPGQQAFAESVTDALVAFVADWTSADQTFDRGQDSKEGRSPRPKPGLRMMPAGSNDPRSERTDAPSGSPPATA